MPFSHPAGSSDRGDLMRTFMGMIRIANILKQSIRTIERLWLLPDPLSGCKVWARFQPERVWNEFCLNHKMCSFLSDSKVLARFPPHESWNTFAGIIDDL